MSEDVGILATRRRWFNYGLAWLAAALSAVSVVLAFLALSLSLELVSLRHLPPDREGIIEALDRKPELTEEVLSGLQESHYHSLSTISSFGDGWGRYMIVIAALLLGSQLTIPRSLVLTRRWNRLALLLSLAGLIAGYGLSGWSETVRNSLGPGVLQAKMAEVRSPAGAFVVLSSSAREVRRNTHLFLLWNVIAVVQISTLLGSSTMAALPEGWRGRLAKAAAQPRC